MRYVALISLLLSGCSAADFPLAAAKDGKPQAEQASQDTSAKDNFRQELAAAIRRGG